MESHVLKEGDLFVLRCSCGDEIMNPNVAKLIEDAEDMGWEIVGENLLCPECAEERED